MPSKTAVVFLRRVSKMLGKRLHCWASRELFVLVQRDTRFYPVAIYSACWQGATDDERLDQLRKGVTALQTRRRKAGDAKDQPPHAAYEDMLERFPALAEFFVSSSFEDGKARRPGWACVWCSGGKWHARLKNDAEGYEIELAAPSWSTLFDMMEGACVDPQAPWRKILGWQDPAESKKRRK